MRPRLALASGSLLAWLLLAVMQAARACLASLRAGAAVHLGAVLWTETVLHLSWALLTLAAFAVAGRVPARRARDLPPHLLAASVLTGMHLGALAAATAAGMLDAEIAAFPVPGHASPGALAAGAAYDLAVYAGAAAVW
ncbi:MAG: hypothetical protein JWM27_3052, partial [Gemmatimonadetes bacterium]|nr:hypothetical protein [Gemmatimonadota bacterium]